MKSRMGCFWLLALLVAVPIFAQQQSATDVPATRDQVKHLFEVMHVHEQMRTTMDAIRKQMHQVMRDAVKKRGPEVTEGEMAKIEAMEAENSKSLDLNGMLDDLIPVYQKHLTKSDIDAMIAFYDTPTGQKLMREQPQMAAESMQAVSARMQKTMDDMMQRVEQMATDEADKEKLKQPSAKPEQRKN